MAYNLTTKSGHNMFTMLSLLQKAVRRGDENLSGYAAYEVYGNYQTVMWNRIMTISAEDCWGVLTKELVYLRAMDYSLNEGLSGYKKNPRFVSKAITLLCKASKSRDACYFACNFIITPNTPNKLSINQKDIDYCYYALNKLDNDIFNIENIDNNTAKVISYCQFIYEDKIGNNSKQGLKNIDEISYYGANLISGIRHLDMVNIGFYIDKLRNYNRLDLWKIILAASLIYTNGELTHEIIALKLTDSAVNGKKTPDKRDEIYLSKAVMLICYHISNKFDSLLSYEKLSYTFLVDWSKYKTINIKQCLLPNNEIPEWVYDVHTIKGKRAGKTDWGMNLVEQAALKPLKKAFFDDGSWELRYDYKIKQGLASQEEYAQCNEYRKTHKGNPVTPLSETNIACSTDENTLDEFSLKLRRCFDDND